MDIKVTNRQWIYFKKKQKRRIVQSQRIHVGMKKYTQTVNCYLHKYQVIQQSEAPQSHYTTVITIFFFECFHANPGQHLFLAGTPLLGFRLG